MKRSLVFYIVTLFGLSALYAEGPAERRRIRLGAVTKAFTAVAVVQLVEAGTLWYDTPVSWWLPYELGGKLSVLESDTGDVRKVAVLTNCPTVKQVLNHTGGFPKDVCVRRGAARVRQMTSVAGGTPLAFRPGEKTLDSDIGYDVLAAAVEAAAKMPFEEYLRTKVIEPLGLTSTGFGPVRTANGMIEFPSGAAGLWTTSEDLQKFFKMLANLGAGDNGARILRPESVKRYFSVSTRPAGFGGCSSALDAPEKDSEDAWFGIGDETVDCRVNWHGKQVRVLVK